MDDDIRLRARVTIEGKVQEVWFRAWVQIQAGERGLTGWVRNRSDGSVEAVFEGPPADVEAVIRACWKGSPGARVQAVRGKPSDPPIADFTILPTA